MTSIPNSQNLHSAIARLLPGGESLSFDLEKSDRNEVRRDFGEKTLFKVVSSAKVLCLALVGRGLLEVKQRSELFERAIPEISVKTIGFGKFEEFDVLLSEYFDGENLETLVESGCVSKGDAIRIVYSVYSAIQKTSIRSSRAKLKQELDNVFEDIAKCSLFNVVDLDILKNRVFPFIRRDLLLGPIKRVCSTGDFIARNILVSSAHEFRVVDYEFAGETHFGWSDYFRWKMYSNVEGISDLNYILESKYNLTPWKEVLFLLQQIVRDVSIVGAVAAADSVVKNLSRVKEIATNNDKGLSDSFFLCGESALSPPLSKDKTFAQLFWSGETGFTEESSVRKEVVLDSLIEFSHDISVEDSFPLDLRFDGCEGASVLEFKRIAVYGEDGAIIFCADAKSGWSDIRCERDAWSLSDKDEYYVLSLGNDPIVIMPRISRESLRQVKVVIFSCEYVIHSDLGIAQTFFE